MNGEAVNGTCIALDDEVVRIQLADESTIEWPRAELIAIGPADAPSITLPWPLDPRASRPPVDAAGLLILPNDDRIVITSASIEDGALHIVRDEGAITIAVPWESIAYWMPIPSRESVELLRGPAARADRLLLSNGDLISGEITKFAPEGIRIDTAAGELMIAAERIAAVALNPELTGLPELPATWMVVLLTDGSRITATHCELIDDSLHVMTQFGGEVSLPVESILRVNCYSERVVGFTSLAIDAWEFEPYVPSDLSGDSEEVVAPRMADRGPMLERANPAWDRSPLGGPLLIRGIEFPRGLGMRPRARLTVSLNGDYQFFQATVGIDDRAEGRGSVEFRIEAEGDILWTSPLITGSDPPLSTGLINIAGREELTLVVDFAEWGDLFDLAVWGKPVLIRGE